MSQTIFLDNNATTFLDPRVRESFIFALEKWGNPSSNYELGRKARQILLAARDSVAEKLQVFPEEIIFTASATEALNVVLRGLFYQPSDFEIIVSSTEHAAVYDTVKDLAAKKFCKVCWVDIEKEGYLAVSNIEKALTDKTRLIVAMAVNNETGVKNDIETIASLARRYEIPFLVDAVALCGKGPLPIFPGVTFLAISGHKFHAPKGVAALFLRKGTKLAPLITGGGQERDLRSGTENIAAIVAFAKALEIAYEEMREASLHMQNLRDYFEESLLKELSFVKVNGKNNSKENRVVNTSNLLFEGVDGEALLFALDKENIAASLGAACSSGALEPSRVLLSMGLSRKEANSSLRFSFSRMNSKEEVELTVSTLCRLAKSLHRESRRF